jgi:hypothetical protein
MSPSRRLTLAVALFFQAFLVLPLFVFVAPLLLGWLLQPIVYRPGEAEAVAVMGVVVVDWSVFLVWRAVRL